MNRMIDLNYLESLIEGYEEDREEFLEMMIETFLEEMPKELKNLELHLKSKDLESLKKNAHKIKSMIASMGMKETLAKINEIELLAAKKEDLELIKKLLLEVSENCEIAFLESTQVLKDLE